MEEPVITTYASCPQVASSKFQPTKADHSKATLKVSKLCLAPMIPLSTKADHLIQITIRNTEIAPKHNSHCPIGQLLGLAVLARCPAWVPLGFYTT